MGSLPGWVRNMKSDYPSRGNGGMLGATHYCMSCFPHWVLGVVLGKADSEWGVWPCAQIDKIWGHVHKLGKRWPCAQG